jgi:hypothetical protein
MSTPTPARLFVLLAREAPVGVIFRRGPRKWVQLIKWKTDTDTFEPGQWIKGQLYERRSDLSPDGSLLAYYLEKREYGRIWDKEYRQAWTAISKPPYFTALALWPNAFMERGGGLLLDSKTFAVYQDTTNQELYAQGSPHRDHQPPKWMKIVPFESSVGRSFDMNIHYERLLRDGWEWVQKGSYDRNLPIAKIEQHFTKTGHCEYEWLDILERSVGNLRLRMELLEPSSIVPGRSYPLDYELIDTAVNETFPIKAHWMDWDQQGRLVYALGGKLFEAECSGGIVTSREIADFTANTFESIIAPDWAKTW